MTVVLHLNTIKKTKLEDPKVKALIAALANNQLLPGANPKPIHKYVFRAKIDEKNRLIYAWIKRFGKQHLLVLDVDPHKYDSEHLNEKYFQKFLLNYQAALYADIDAEVAAQQQAQEEGAGSSSTKPKADIQMQPMQMYDGELLQLGPYQEAVRLPAIVEGGPGTGKTCVAAHLLQQAQAEQKVLYITRSKGLIDSVTEILKENPGFDSLKDRIDILTYDELNLNLNPEQPFTETEAKTAFSDWFGTYRNNGNHKADTVFQEFRIISGYAADDYINAGEKHTLYSAPEMRASMLKAYNAWVEHCAKNNLRFSDFHPVHTSENKARKYDAVYSDETQDWSHLQSRQLFSLAKNNNIVFFIDQGQSLDDDNSKVIFLKSLFDGGSVYHAKLEISYRCAPNIARAALGIKALRKEATLKQKAEPEFQVSEEDQGTITWRLDQKDHGEYIAGLKDELETCVITTEENKPKLMALGIAQVYTVKGIKGLQYKKVVIDNLLEDRLFVEINNAMNEDGGFSGHQDKSFASPLNNIFTAVTRAKDELVICENKSRRVRNIITRIRNTQKQTTLEVASSSSENLAPKPTYTREQWLDRAKKLYLSEHEQQAKNILHFTLNISKNEVKKITAEWLGRKPAEETDDTSKTKGKKAAKNQGPQGKDKDHLSKLLRENNFREIWVLLNNADPSDTTGLINWRGADGLKVLEHVCAANPDGVGHEVCIISRLLEDFNVDPNAKTSNGTVFVNVVLAGGSQYLIDFFMLNDRFDLEMHIEAINNKDPSFAHHIQERLVRIYDVDGLEENRAKIIDFFIKHFPDLAHQCVALDITAIPPDDEGFNKLVNSAAVNPTLAGSVSVFITAVYGDKQALAQQFFDNDDFDMEEHFHVIIASDVPSRNTILENLVKLYAMLPFSDARQEIFNTLLNYSPEHAIACIRQELQAKGYQYAERCIHEILLVDKISYESARQLSTMLSQALREIKEPRTYAHFDTLLAYFDLLILPASSALDITSRIKDLVRHSNIGLPFADYVMAACVANNISNPEGAPVSAKIKKENQNELSRLAESGLALAARDMGRILQDQYQQTGVANIAHAMTKFYTIAAEEGDIPSCISAGLCYELGLAQDGKDLSCAYQFYSKAAAANLPAGIEHQSRCLREGMGVEQNTHEAYELCYRYAKRGNVIGMYFLAEHEEQGINREKNPAAAHRYRQQIYQTRVHATQMTYARSLMYGIGCEQNKAEAASILRTINPNHFEIDTDALTQAYCNALEDEIFVPEGCDRKVVQSKIYQIYNTLANNKLASNKLAKYNLGRCYEYGIGVERNFKLAFEWYVKGSEAGCLDAMLAAKQCAHYGLGCDASVANAEAWDAQYTKHAELTCMVSLDAINKHMSNLIKSGSENEILTVLDASAHLPYWWDCQGSGYMSLLIKTCKTPITATSNKIVERLINRKKANINMTDIQGNSAFIYLCFNNAPNALYSILPLFLLHPSFETDFLKVFNDPSAAKKKSFVIGKLNELRFENLKAACETQGIVFVELMQRLEKLGVTVPQDYKPKEKPKASV